MLSTILQCTEQVQLRTTIQNVVAGNAWKMCELNERDCCKNSEAQTKTHMKVHLIKTKKNVKLLEGKKILSY